MGIVISADIKKDAKQVNGDIPGQVVVGLPGPPGISPHIGTNGNWFIGENDTGVPATGPASPPIPGGKAGQYLRKKSDADGDIEWADSFIPVKGKDYWTDADKMEIKSYVDEAILGGVW